MYICQNYIEMLEQGDLGIECCRHSSADMIVYSRLLSKSHIPLTTKKFQFVGLSNIPISIGGGGHTSIPLRQLSLENLHAYMHQFVTFFTQADERTEHAWLDRILYLQSTTWSVLCIAVYHMPGQNLASNVHVAEGDLHLY